MTLHLDIKKQSLTYFSIAHFEIQNRNVEHYLDKFQSFLQHFLLPRGNMNLQRHEKIRKKEQIKKMIFFIMNEMELESIIIEIEN